MLRNSAEAELAEVHALGTLKARTLTLPLHMQPLDQGVSSLFLTAFLRKELTSGPARRL